MVNESSAMLCPLRIHPRGIFSDIWQQVEALCNAQSSPQVTSFLDLWAEQCFFDVEAQMRPVTWFAQDTLEEE